MEGGVFSGKQIMKWRGKTKPQMMGFHFFALNLKIEVGMGSACGLRAVFGGPPKTLFPQISHPVG
jgi:hypothetical protein